MQRKSASLRRRANNPRKRQASLCERDNRRARLRKQLLGGVRERGRATRVVAVLSPAWLCRVVPTQCRRTKCRYLRYVISKRRRRAFCRSVTVTRGTQPSLRRAHTRQPNDPRQPNEPRVRRQRPHQDQQSHHSRLATYSILVNHAHAHATRARSRHGILMVRVHMCIAHAWHRPSSIAPAPICVFAAPPYFTPGRFGCARPA